MLIFPTTSKEKKELTFFLGFILLYVLWIYFFVGFRDDHYWFVGIWLVLFFSSRKSRNFLFTFGYLIIYWILYDSMRLYPNYLFNEVNILEPYVIEKQWFGVNMDGIRMTWNEYFQQNTNKLLDFITGIFYFSWVTVPFAYCIYLFFKKEKEILVGFTISFLLVNFIGWILYYLYPAAPPWYYELYGDVFIPETVGHAGGLLRFDAIVGSPFFEDMYAKGSSVFGAVPSLHAAFPILLTYFSLKRRNPILTLLFVLTIIGIWFGAVYTNHHYILDLILGLFCAILTIIIYEKLIQKRLKKYLIDPILRL